MNTIETDIAFTATFTIIGLGISGIVILGGLFYVLYEEYRKK